jgi:hypothetical protein
MPVELMIVIYLLSILPSVLERLYKFTKHYIWMALSYFAIFDPITDYMYDE